MEGSDQASLDRLAAAVLTELKSKGMTLAAAESCTGGLVSHTLTNIPGSSENFDSGFVTYSNDAKVRVLGVSEDTLEKFGAVSSQTVEEMAEGVRKVRGADLGLGISGIAGPGGGTPEKPVGLVFIAVSGPNGTKWREFGFDGNRTEIKNSSAKSVLELLNEYLREM